MSNPATSLPPGFRFHPTDEELIIHYMRNRAASAPCPISIIAEVDIYKFDPWELPAKAMFGDREWYFFSPRERKYPNGIRPNRSAASGYWKATGTDKPIHGSIGNEHIGVKKALVFYKGRPPKGLKTNWIMHEYRLAESHSSNSYKPMKLRDSSMRLDDWVLCRIYKKSNHLPSAEPPLMIEREQEEHNVPIIHNIQLETTLKFPRSSSISEFFDDYPTLCNQLDNLPEMPGSEDGSLIGNPSVNNSNDINYFVQHLSQAKSPDLIAGNYLKRQWPVEEESSGLLHPSKRWSDSRSFTSFADQLDSSQCSMMNQSLLNQQLLLNSHLELQ